MNRIFRRSVAALALFTLPYPLVVADPILLEVEDFKGPWRKQTNISGFLGKGWHRVNFG